MNRQINFNYELTFANYGIIRLIFVIIDILIRSCENKVKGTINMFVLINIMFH